MNRKEYEEDLKRRQNKHLRAVEKRKQSVDSLWVPCAHEKCEECIGTNIKKNGSQCIHYLVCNCPKCRPMMNGPGPRFTLQSNQ